MVGAPPLTHDRASIFQTSNTVAVDTRDDCSFLYIPDNYDGQYSECR
jgi:hypothetical protein